MNGNQSFFHCFVFFEEVDEYQIYHDFDYGGTLAQVHTKYK